MNLVLIQSIMSILILALPFTSVIIFHEKYFKKEEK